MRDELKTIWSFFHDAPPDVERARELIDMGVGLGIDGIEMAVGIEECVTFQGVDGLQGPGESDDILDRRRAVQEVANYAQSQGLRVGMWLRELSGPANLLELLPDLRAEDGFVNLESPRIADLIEGTLSEFCEAVPEVDEIVLTITERQAWLLRRPFSDMPLAERALLVIEPVLDAARYYGKAVAVRPASPLAEHCRAVMEALDKVFFDELSVMLKTEPHDWHPFQPTNPNLRKVKSYELRAETDAFGERYGMGFFPACCPQYLMDRLRVAADRGTTAFTLRADSRGRPAVHTLNEINLFAATAWLKDQSVGLDGLCEVWAKGRLGAAPEGLKELLEQTFEVVKKSLYLDWHAMSRDLFPSFGDAKAIQLFSLFEEAESLRHLRDNWCAVSAKPAPARAAIVREKENAASMAAALAEWFAGMADAFPEARRPDMAQGLRRLELVARGALALCRLVAAHLEDMWNCEERAVGRFDEEAQACLALADEVERTEGEGFFGHMPTRMREFVEKLRGESEIEAPRRQALDADKTVVDYVLCGLASEGHKLYRRLGAGFARVEGALFYRATGPGDLEGFSYEVRVPETGSFSIEADVLAGAQPSSGVLWLGPNRFPIEADAPERERLTHTFEVDAKALESPARIEIFSATAEPVRVAEIRVRASG